jgi:hypothetical protein
MENLLHRISVKAIHELTQGTEDCIEIQEKLERTTQKIGVTNGVDLIGVRHISDSNKLIIFSLGNYEKVIWVFELPEYDYGDETDGDEGVVEWLTRASVKLYKDNIQINQDEIREIEKLIGS